MARTVTRARPVTEKHQVIRLLRVSRMLGREVGDAAFHSPDLQIRGIDAEFDKIYGRGEWELVDVMGNHGRATWADFDKSGGTMDRAGLNAAIDALGTTGAHALGVYNISRWGRIVADGLKRMDELQRAGVKLISAMEPTDRWSPEGNFMVQLFLGMAELQRRQAAVSWSNVIERRATEQGRHHGVPPFGFRRPVIETDEETGKVKTGGDIVKDPDTGPVLVGAFEEIDKGSTRWAVGHQMAADGHIARWEYVVGWFTNRAYLRLHAKECIGTTPPCTRTDHHGPYGEVRAFDYEGPLAGSRKERVRVAEAWFPGSHEGLIEVDLWDRVQARLVVARAENEERTRRRWDSAVHELAGVCRCRYCTKALWLGHVRDRLVLRDPSMQRTGCRGVGVPSADAVLAEVLRQLAEVVATAGPEAVRLGAERDRKKGKSGERKADMATLQRRRKGVEQRIADVESEKASGEYQGDADLTLDGLRTKLAGIKAEEAALTAPPPPPIVVPPVAADFLRNYTDLSVQERNAFFREHCVVMVSQRPDGAPWRVPYEERVKVRWAWDRS